MKSPDSLKAPVRITARPLVRAQGRGKLCRTRWGRLRVPWSSRRPAPGFLTRVLPSVQLRPGQGHVQCWSWFTQQPQHRRASRAVYEHVTSALLCSAEVQGTRLETGAPRDGTHTCTHTRSHTHPEAHTSRCTHRARSKVHVQTRMNTHVLTCTPGAAPDDLSRARAPEPRPRGAAGWP